MLQALPAVQRVATQDGGASGRMPHRAAGRRRVCQRHAGTAAQRGRTQGCCVQLGQPGHTPPGWGARMAVLVAELVRASAAAAASSPRQGALLPGTSVAFWADPAGGFPAQCHMSHESVDAAGGPLVFAIILEDTGEASFTAQMLCDMVEGRSPTIGSAVLTRGEIASIENACVLWSEYGVAENQLKPENQLAAAQSAANWLRADSSSSPSGTVSGEEAASDAASGKLGWLARVARGVCNIFRTG